MPEIHAPASRAFLTAVVIALLALAPGVARADGGRAASSRPTQVQQADAVAGPWITSPTSGAIVRPGDVRIAGVGTPGDRIEVHVIHPMPGPPFGDATEVTTVDEHGTWSVELWLLTPSTYQAVATSDDSPHGYPVTFKVA